MFRLCCSDGTQTHGYIPSSVYRTSTQYRLQRYPTFSMHGHLPRRRADGGSPSVGMGASACDEVGCHHDEHCTYQANTSHLLSSDNSSTSESQVTDGVAMPPSAASNCVQVSTSDSRSEFMRDQSQYISSCQTATFRHYESRVCRGTNRHTLSSNFYSTSSHYSTRSILTMPASSAANLRHVPFIPSAISAATSHSVTAAQHRQNVIEISKPFESSDVLRYSEKLRRQRLNNSAIASADFCNLSH